jgi:hypothetical protein
VISSASSLPVLAESVSTEKRAPSGARAMGWRTSAAAGVAAARRVRHQVRARGRGQDRDPRPLADRLRSHPGASGRALTRRAAPCPWRLLPVPGLVRAFEIPIRCCGDSALILLMSTCSMVAFMA